ncbi:membrane protein insertion efficiency factor YidD [Bacteroidetes bacterium endosymbiont of Geopemphigus sp.]|uniref:membrane protein insertion efficiency factor YidD n=1 Tax=Bacteroidetes bacterium endosymbiont of Geopemphigus sp. TaxID=2047937 RepID=UPI000CD2FA98|nr:membrane protein insertion efficiency factor YidD [Bacteroidetes bacterium endosymbiont of Geopemphigus sp.]
MKVLRKITIWPFIILIRVYQRAVSPWLGENCRFVPSCSAYVMEALKTYGLFYGSFLGLKRILRCHPWSKDGYDPLTKENT